MNIEFEAKFYIEPDSFKNNLKQQGGRVVKPLNLMKRWIFLHDNMPNSWVRVRDENDRIALSYKIFDTSKTIDSLQELEVVVDDFEKTSQMITLLGWKKIRYVENIRETWQLLDCLLMIDQWPALEMFVEIEGPSQESVEAVARLLGLDMNLAYFGPTARLYEQQYGISKVEFDQIHIISFENIPQMFQK